jgi:mannose-6-phosphate isomerase-like protein (cupin superfamily)
MRPRRVVTAEGADGKSVVLSDERLEPITAALLGSQELSLIWGADKPFSLPSDGTTQVTEAFYPPPGGFRFWCFTLPPDSDSPVALNGDGGVSEVNEKLPGLLAVLEQDNPRMHTTDTVDVDLVVSGEVWLELDDGVEVHLREGDCAVLNGNRHAWRNRSTQTAVIAVAIVGARRLG